ncbi:NUDIX hydrolase [Geomicrobium sp. JCM 19037]|uniref:NUDIX hydrolase n=1 Tax=Geomicrobium sp. JCM 19037 TaxID=1460634 RepID=UPI0027D792F3|nr:NUDIX hydrolase [Geomicrobium sp. JCM 19037]
MNYLKRLREKVGQQPLIVTGATVIVKNHKGEILMQKRSDTNDWGLPGGAMEMGESLEETAKRELYEETGLRAETLQLVAVKSGRDYYYKYPNGDEVYNVIALYLTDNTSGTLAINDDEARAWLFFTRSTAFTVRRASSENPKKCAHLKNTAPRRWELCFLTIAIRT